MKLGPYDLDQIYTGDARELAKAIPDESVDLIFTDPPYPEEFLPLYGWLAETAARILKPTGYIFALCGSMFLLDVMNYFSKSLTYISTCGMGNGRERPPLWPIKAYACWKPMIWFSRGNRNTHGWILDFFRPEFADKRFHEWGQPEDHAGYYIDKMSETNSVIFDPFAGGGTVPAVCKMLGRHYLAFEIDPDTAERARQRVEMTQPPLLIPEPEQVEMFAEARA